MTSSTLSLRQDALSIFQAGIDAADPYQAVKNSLTLVDNHLEIALDLADRSKKRCGKWSQIHLIAFGKAACKMIMAAEEIIPEHLLANKPLAITNVENVIALKNIEVLGANHPIPDSAGREAAEYLANKLKQTKTGELVLVLISGGGSALIPYPVDGITLEDKQLTTDLLLASGASIQQINCVRKHLSQLKGGQLAQLATPADCHALILSDVIGDDLSSIASGPTVPDNTTFADAIEILKSKNIWAKTPLTVQDVLKLGQHETPKTGDPCFNNSSHTLVGSNSISLNAVSSATKRLGYITHCFNNAITGEARDIADQLVLAAKQHANTGLSQAVALIAGGESTVTLKGTGRGGRNQEMALAFAIAAEKQHLKAQWVFLSGGTDGLDGPTDAAGGLVDHETMLRLKNKHISPEQKLNNNDSYSALKESKDLIITGATGTNVADLQILLIQPE